VCGGTTACTIKCDGGKTDTCAPGAISSTTTTIAFSSNTRAGIFVDSTGQVTITGTPGVNDLGTVVANASALAGLEIKQDPNAVVPLNTVTGLVTWGTTNGSGVKVYGGSRVKIRSSRSLNNSANGVEILSNTDVNPANSAINFIDLGTGIGDFGLNTLQAATNSNGAAGVCLNTDVGVGVSASVAGNTFNGTDCSLAASATVTLSKSNGCAASAAHYALGNAGASVNTFVTTYCQN
jgi:hypothetical protein